MFHPVVLPEMEAAVLSVLRSGQIASGPKVAEFERVFSTLAEREHVVATNDMTSAATLALRLAGVRDGDEVATLAFSCLSSNAPIAKLGARAVWVDIEPSTLSMSVCDLAKKLNPRVKAVFVYHVAGYPADIEQIAQLCRSRGIPLIEDCNNALGAKAAGKPVGAYGDYSIYSIYPNRQINGIEGGLLATPDAATAAKARRLRRFGIDASTFRDDRGEIDPTSEVDEIGWSAALSNLNAAVAVSQFNSLTERLQKTSVNAAYLASTLRCLPGLKLIETTINNSAAYWGFGIMTPQRDLLLAHLKANSIKTSILHQRNDIYRGFGTGPSSLSGTEVVMTQFLALPCGWWLREDELQKISSEVIAFFEQQ